MLLSGQTCRPTLAYNTQGLGFIRDDFDHRLPQIGALNDLLAYAYVSSVLGLRTEDKIE